LKHSARAGALSQPAIIVIFEDLRQQWIELVGGLSDEAFQDNPIKDRLHIEIIGHFEEHRIS